MKIRLCLVIKNPFKLTDIKRFNINELNKNFDLIILDCSAWLLPESIKTRGVSTISLPNLKVIKNKNDLRDALTNNGGYALDFVGLFSFNAVTLFNILKKKDIKIIVIDSGPFPSPGPTKSSLNVKDKISIIIKNKLFVRFIYARLLKIYQFLSADMTPDIALVSGSSWMYNPRFSLARRIIPAHSFDYETFIEVNEFPKKDEVAYAVYLDENLVFHEDNKEMNLKPPVSVPHFLIQLEMMFREVESITGLSVKVAAYPSSDPSIYREYFKGRDIVMNNTAEMIKNAQLVFAHASTAISFAVLWRKPVFFITNNEISKSWYFADIEAATRAIKRPLINLDNFPIFSSYFIKWDSIDNEAYEKYEWTYIKCKTSEKISLWMILKREIKDFA